MSVRCVVLATLALAGCAASVRGVVFVDRNRDGVWQKGDEPGVANATVALDHRMFTTTNAKGEYTFTAATPAAHVWVSVPDGYRPGPVYGRATAQVDLPLTALSEDEIAAPLSFVVAADTHATPRAQEGPWNGGDLEGALRQALALPLPPRFFTIVGDVTQGNQDAEFERVESAVRDVAVPWVPVPGNHDWYDGGATWRARWGPDNYSFDAGGVHFVVWDTNLPPEDQLDFFERELAHVDRDAIVVALGHDSPEDAVGDRLAELGVDYLFTGHWHSNRRVERAGMIEWGTQTFMMGTIDQSPAGYRIVTFVDGVPIVEHRARLVEPHLAITSPHAGSCAAPAGFDLLVAAALDAGSPAVTARVDCGLSSPLSPRGGWSFGAPLVMPAGAHRIDVTATTPRGRTLTRHATFDVCAHDAPPRVTADWPQPGGGPRHDNATAHAIAPPLEQAWATSVGGNVVLGTPVVANGVVVVALWDLGAGDRGGVVALDLATGTERWRYQTPLQARAAPAIDGDLVVIALATGEVHAVGLADGALRWTHDAAHGIDSRRASLWGSPTIAGGIVYVAVQGRMSAINASDGNVVWERALETPPYAWLGSLAAVTVAGGAAIANYDRANGMTAWEPTTGERRWHMAGNETIAINATPVAVDGRLYVANSAGQVFAMDLATSARRWTKSIVPEADDWSYAITATPAVAGGRVFVPTQHRDLVALDATTGSELWRVTTPGGPLQFAHYRAAEPGFAASPVVTGDVLWVPRPDGMLVAVSVADGRERWSTQLGAPIVSAPAPAGDYLIVATFDGTVRALAPAIAPPPVVHTALLDAECPAEESDPPASDEAGCCSTGSSSSPPIAMVVLVVWRLGRRRRASIAACSA
ncbi:MAG: PQQ-binding-like beta-propeller repeat protein [Kofleriaceae bacterium]